MTSTLKGHAEVATLRERVASAAAGCQRRVQPAIALFAQDAEASVVALTSPWWQSGEPKTAGEQPHPTQVVQRADAQA